MEGIISNHERGAALIVALVMLLILTMLGIMAIDLSRHEVNIVANQRIYNAAFYAAESGLDEFRTAPPVNNPNPGIPFTSSKSIGTSANSYRYKWDRIAMRNVGGLTYHVFKVTAEGTAPNFPNAGRVNIETVIEVYAGATGGAGGEGSGGSALDQLGQY